MIIYPKKTITTVYIILVISISVIFGVSFVVQPRKSVQYWTLFLGIFSFLTPLYSFLSYIKIDKNHIIVRRDIRQKYGCKKVDISLDEIDFIEEIETKTTFRGKLRSTYSFRIHTKGRDDSNLIYLNINQYFAKDLKWLFLTLEQVYKVNRKVIVSGSHF